MDKEKPDWIIHCVRSTGNDNFAFLPGTSNSHTHGMENYGHPDFQLVIAYDDDAVAYLLNTIGMMVREGYRFKAGDYIEGIFLDCLIRLDEVEETGRNVLRLIIPDKNGRWPEAKDCEWPYNLQLIPTDDLIMDAVPS